MTKKDFDAIAGVLNEQYDLAKLIDDGSDLGPRRVRVIAYNLSNLFERTNPRFDRQKFRDAALGEYPMAYAEPLVEDGSVQP